MDDYEENLGFYETKFGEKGLEDKYNFLVCSEDHVSILNNSH